MFNKFSGHVSPYRNKQEEGLGTLKHYRARGKRETRNIWVILLIASLIIAFIVLVYSHIDGHSYFGQWAYIFHIAISYLPGNMNTHEVL